MSTPPTKSKSNQAAWWNGVGSVALVIDIDYLFKSIWAHNWDGIWILTVIGCVLFLAWFMTLVNIE